MHKKAQVTSFILLGIIIVIIAGISIYFFGSRLQQQTITPLDQAQLIPLQTQVESCMLASVEKTLDALKKHAFYLQATPYTMQYGGASINYLLYPENAPNKLNALAAIQEAISQQLEADMKNCRLDNLKLKLKQDKSVIKASTSIGESSILISLEYPIQVSKGSTSTQLKEFSIAKQSDLGLIYNAVQDIIAGELQGDFDPVEYSSTSNIVINKNNLDSRSALYLVSSEKEQDYLLFAIRKS